jgi:transcription elongation factor GreA
MAEVIDVTKLDAQGKVVFGATVTLEDQDTEEEVKYQIVGDDEADIKRNLVSISSPISRALIGREKGDIAVVKAPNGEREYEVIEIQYI